MLPPKLSGEETLPAEVHETCGEHLWTYDAATASWACVAQLAPILNQPAINSKRGMFRINTRFRDGEQQQTLIISGAIKYGREGADRSPSRQYELDGSKAGNSACGWRFTSEVVLELMPTAADPCCGMKDMCQ